MTLQAFQADLIFTGREWHKGKVLLVREGVVEGLCLPEEVPQEAIRHNLSGKLLLPGGVNSHSHAFQILLRGKADSALNFRDWVDHYLYPLVLALDKEDLYTGALLAFSEMALSGVTTVGEFYYIQNGPDFRSSGNELAEVAIQAAKDVGIRICLLRTLYNCQNKEGQKRFYEPVKESIAHLRALREAYKNDPYVQVLPAPHSLHGATSEAIQEGATLAREWGSKFHIHLAEEKHDLPFAEKLYGTTPLRALQKLGVLDEHLVIVHGCHLDDEEIELLGQAKGGLAYNPYSNMALGDGITDLAKYVQSGVTVSLGTDGACANNTVDLFGEMRAAEYLQRVSKFQMNVLSPLWKERGHPFGIFAMATEFGGQHLCMPVGTLEKGNFADFCALDLQHLSFLPTYSQEPTVLYHQLLYSVPFPRAVSHVVVGGEFVVQEGHLCRLSLQEVHAAAERVGKKLAQSSLFPTG